ncbi:TPA: hypothetical protein N0F65_006016 [Lagenidium giganteum]|uniref:Uncharacterized protein n=1 Tax=Lagenidium giganteum TaxID=4803 RepID=A0AAV2Z4K0_9STRA|nr:TPA: hypothetical protein N0F65_006016 [Lagenidium giganteum]
MHKPVRQRPEENERQAVREHAAQDESRRAGVEVFLDVAVHLEHEHHDGRDQVQRHHQRKAAEPREPNDAGNAARHDAHGRVAELDHLLVVLHVLNREKLDILAQSFHRDA